jgi:ribose transport system substrate-binding protein
MELPRAGNLPRMRLTGLLVGVKEILPNLSNCPVRHIDGDGCFDKSFEAARKHLRSTNARRIIVGAINDTSALGALRAFQEAGRTDRCVVMSHNASPEGRAELREPNTRLVGSVGYFPERYGEDLIRVSLDLLNRRPVPPAVFVKHQIITPETVDHFYPNDGLMQTVLAGGSGAAAWSPEALIGPLQGFRNRFRFPGERPELHFRAAPGWQPPVGGNAEQAGAFCHGAAGLRKR